MRWRTSQAALFPELFAEVQEMAQDIRSAEVSLHSYLNLDEERRVLDALVSHIHTFHGELVSYEHDGCTALLPEVDLQYLITSFSAARIAVKSHDYMSLLQEHNPGEDWTKPSSFSFAEYESIYKDVLLVLRNRSSPHGYSMVFAQYVSAQVENLLFRLKDDFEEWDTKKFCWKTTVKEKDIKLIDRVLVDHLPFRRLRFDSKADKFVTDPNSEKPWFLKSDTLVRHMLKTVRAYLESSQELPDLDGDHARYKVLFEGGIVYDFTTGRTRCALPRDRMAFHLAVAYKECEPT